MNKQRVIYDDFLIISIFFLVLACLFLLLLLFTIIAFFKSLINILIPEFVFVSVFLLLVCLIFSIISINSFNRCKFIINNDSITAVRFKSKMIINKKNIRIIIVYVFKKGSRLIIVPNNVSDTYLKSFYPLENDIASKAKRFEQNKQIICISMSFYQIKSILDEYEYLADVISYSNVL